MLARVGTEHLGYRAAVGGLQVDPVRRSRGQDGVRAGEALLGPLRGHGLASPLRGSRLGKWRIRQDSHGHHVPGAAADKGRRQAQRGRCVG